MRAPAASLLALPLTAGCAGGLLCAELVSDAAALRVAAAAAFCLIAAIACCADEQIPDTTIAVALGALLAGVSLGQSAARHAYHPPIVSWFASTAPDARTSVVLRGTLREDAAMTAAGVAITIDLTHVGDRSIAGGVRLSVAGTIAARAMHDWRAGRRVIVTASLREPTEYLNPGVPPERRALARRGVALVGSVKSAALVEITAHGSAIDEWSARARAWTRAALASSVGAWNERSAGIATAIVIGDRTGLTDEDERRLQEAGTYHVIAISGGNVALFTILMLVVFRAVRVPVKAASAFTIVALLAYARVAGSAPSVDRAIAAAVLLLAGRLFEHRGASMNVLGTAAVLALARAPTTVFDPGFILSFGATTAILVAVSIETRTRTRARSTRAVLSVARTARGLLTATVAAELALGPMTAALFGRITCAGLILNFAAIPLMSIVQAGSFAALIASAIAPDAARWSGYVVHLAARGLMDSSRLVEFVPWVARDVAPPSWAVVAIYYAALVIAVAIVRLRRIAALVATLFAVVIVIGPHVAARDAIARAPHRSLRLAFLDVGQGDATLVVLPDGRALLVDAGGLPAGPLRDPDSGFDVGERVVVRALRAFGVRALDTFVVTHGDPDHIGGGSAVVRSFRPRAIWEGVSVPRHAPVAALRDEAMRIGAEWRNVRAGDRLHVAGVEILAIHPPSPEWERQRVRNDDSVVLVIKYGAVTMLLPGDIGREGERAAMPQIERSSIVLLKAPHHGSATSSTQEFLEAVRPAIAIVSAGRDNRFGHPAPVVVARYRAMGVTMFSTAEDGAVIVDTDGRKVHVTGSVSGRSLYMSRRADGTVAASDFVEPRATKH